MSVPPETYLDEFPSDWQLMELGSIANVKGGKRLPKGAEYADTITDHAYLRVTDFENLSVNLADLKYISEDVHEHVARYTISSDDVYISIAGTIGLVGTIPDELNGANLTENAAKIVVLDQDVLHARFLAYWLSSPQGQAETRLRTTKTSQPKLALMRIRQIPIPLPPLAEQRRIAGVLNTIQDAIAAQEDVIAAARELKRSLMQRLFTYGPYREPAETKETEIGEIPVHWEMVEFGSQVDLLSGYAFKSEHYTDDYNAPRLLRGDNIAQGRLRWDNEKRWPLDGTEDIDRYWLRPGDVVLAMDRPWIPAGMKCAMVAESDVPSLLVQRVARLRPKKLDTSSFVKYLLTGHRFADYVLSVQTGTSVPHISGQQIRSFKLGLPPVSEQIQIGEELESVETKIAAEEDRLTALQALFKSMLHQLMTGQIRLLSDDGEFPVT